MVVPSSQLNLIGQWVEFYRRLNLESSSYSCTRRNSSSVRANLVPRPLCGEEAWFAHVPSSLGNLHATLFTCWKATLQSYTPCETPLGNIAFTEMVYIASFEVIGKLKKHQSRAAEFSWNGQTHEQFLQVKSWVVLLLPCYCLHRAWSVLSIFHTAASRRLV